MLSVVETSPGKEPYKPLPFDHLTWTRYDVANIPTCPIDEVRMRVHEVYCVLTIVHSTSPRACTSGAHGKVHCNHSHLLALYDYFQPALFAAKQTLFSTTHPPHTCTNISTAFNTPSTTTGAQMYTNSDCLPVHNNGRNHRGAVGQAHKLLRCGYR